MSSTIGKLSNAQLRKIATELAKAGRLKGTTTASVEKLNTAHEKVIGLVAKQAPDLEARVRKLLGISGK
jgi:hypothetical protein